MVKSLDNFEFDLLPHLSEALVWELATSDFITRKENIVLIGPPGTGKSHLTLALGYKPVNTGTRCTFFLRQQGWLTNWWRPKSKNAFPGWKIGWPKPIS